MKSDSYIICIGRQLGSGGREVAQKLAQKLGIAYYDKEIIAEAAKESGLDLSCFEKVDEIPSNSFLNCFAGGFEFPFYPVGTTSESSYLGGNNLFQIQSDTIVELAKKGSAVFVGRAADYVLREHPRMLSLFLTASFEDRIARVSKLMEISDEKAKEMIVRCDKKRAEFYNYYTFRRWGDAAGYDICLNTSIHSIDEVVEEIVSVVNEQFLR